MKILVTGSYGQLGNEIKKLTSKYNDWQFLFTDADTLDIASEKAVQEYFQKYSPEFVINCAAYTAVDKAESEVENATLINAVAPGLLAKITAKTDAGFVHISTDYVFDGKHFRPYLETDEVNPQTVYGKTKLAGEQSCVTNNPDSVIIRTSWLYSSFGNNFVKTMLRLGKERDFLNVVYDQIGTPTYAADLANAVLLMAENFGLHNENYKPGVYHFSNEGVASWYDFAKAILEIGRVECKVNPILTRDFPTPAQRPHFSVLDKSKIKDTVQLEIPHWRESLNRCMGELHANLK